MITDLYDREYACPVCDHVFSTKKVRRSAIRLESRESDFKPNYSGENPLHYMVCVCPNCGYSSLESEFNNIEKSSITNVRMKIRSNWIKRSFGDVRDTDIAIETYKLALVSGQASSLKFSMMGLISLRLAWLYRDKNSDEELRYLSLAKVYYEKAYNEEYLDDNPDNEIQILFSLGEINRRLGYYNDAIKWFSKTLEHKDIKKKRHIELKARDQWSEAKREYTLSK
ncbi:MAG: DUF2225 domain-containing protein [Firmicutes bacterium]|nr:DUF2225 domain-containing protein [Bacillota bacterium]